MAKTTDMTGRIVGPWTVLDQVKPPSHHSGTQGAFWLCRCVCGKTEAINGGRLRAGRMKRGCVACAGKLHKKGGKGASPTHNSWRAMRARCHRPDDMAYARYGARGIQVCERWRHSFVNFLADMGARPPGHTLDRIDPLGNYEPSNCRWADAKVQARGHLRLSDEQIEAIVSAAAAGALPKDLATIAGVERVTIAEILAGGTVRSEHLIDRSFVRGRPYQERVRL